MQENQNIQKSVLFDGSVPCIDTTSNDSNIVHKNTVTSLSSNDTQKNTNLNLTNFITNRNHRLNEKFGLLNHHFIL